MVNPKCENTNIRFRTSLANFSYVPSWPKTHATTFEVLNLAKLMNKHGAKVEAHRNTTEAGVQIHDLGCPWEIAEKWSRLLMHNLAAETNATVQAYWKNELNHWCTTWQQKQMQQFQPTGRMSSLLMHNLAAETNTATLFVDKLGYVQRH